MEKAKLFHHLKVVVISVAIYATMSFIGPKIVFVAGESMLPTYENGDFLILSTYASPSVGDVIVVRTDSTKNVVKRIVGVSGDTIELIDGQLYRNDRIVIEEYIIKDHTNMEPVIVPDGMIYVLGDNRPNSIDSRDYGPVPTEVILGKVRTK